jgi:hypothetical protein
MTPCTVIEYSTTVPIEFLAQYGSPFSCGYGAEIKNPPRGIIIHHSVFPSRIRDFRIQDSALCTRRVENDSALYHVCSFLPLT